MAYEVKLTIKGEEIPFKRTETPFFKDTTRALILQQHQVKMWGKTNGPTDEDLMNNEKDVANFASSFFNNQFTAKDFIDGAHSESTVAISKIIDECLGTSDPDGSDKTESKK